MAKYISRHDVDDGVYVYKQSNSNYWYARFKIDNKWLSKATKKKNLKEAKIEAIKLQTQFKIMSDNNIPVHTSRKLKKHSFNSIAKLAINRMEDTKTEVNEKNFKKHIDTLRQLHIPFFGKYSIREIDEALLGEFDKWREEKLKRVPAKNTIKKHNAAMQRVLDEAVIQKYITQTELPALTNNGRSGARRAAFKKTEYKQIVKAAKEWIEESPRKDTQYIREMLYYYIQVAANTGIRPGTEMENLTWDDVNHVENEGKAYSSLTVRKGKTTNYTGTREVVVKDEIDDLIIDDLYEFCDSNDGIGDKSISGDLSGKMFSLKRTDVLGKNFVKLLKRLGLEKDAHGNRSLYSLRHSYITWELQNGTDLRAIAAQCGTSIEMIERHYSHVVPAMFANKLSGRTIKNDES
jgi:integrase